MAFVICVTGGAGFIGSHVADALLDAGHRVIIVDDLSSGRKENVPAGAELVVEDIRNPAAAGLLAEREVEILVHHAAQMDVRKSVEDPKFDADVNILGMVNLLEAARKARVRQVVFASTGGAIYGEQDVHPADEKHPARPVSP
jgi:UDP-glucose 4-epimerase